MVGSGVGVTLGNDIGNRVEGEKKLLPLQEGYWLGMKRGPG